eukprot:m.108906 g.108906  ORF g.108906 m.108906 type:complete len:246 (+) comp10677_c0_seq1:75-812(+)
MMGSKRYYKVPIAPVEGAFGFDTRDRTSMGYWLAEFDGQETVRQLELHPRKTPVLLERGHPDICPHTLDETNLVFKPHLEIFVTEFENEWTNAQLIAAAERGTNGGEAVQSKHNHVDNNTAQDSTRHEDDDSPDEPLPDVPTPSPELVDQDHDKPRRPPQRPAPAPPPPGGASTHHHHGDDESAEFKRFREMLAQAAGNTTAGGNEYADMWARGAKVVASLEGTSGFDKEHFTRFLYHELMKLGK